MAGIAVILGAGPTSSTLISGSQGAGIARAFVRKGYAVALLARSKDKLEALATDLRGSHDGAIAYAFPSDTSRASLQKAFDDIRSHEAYKGLRLATSIWHVKHSSRAPFLEVTEDTLDEMMQTYIKGAFNFAQISIPLLLEGNKAEPSAPPGTLIFTGTLGALRCSANFASYGISRAAVRQLAQSLAREYVDQGVHVVHTILNGAAGEDEEAEKAGKKMNPEEIGDAYAWLSEQRTAFTHELDLRPPAEKF